MTTIDLTRAEAVDRMQSIHEHMESLASKHRMSKADAVEFDEASAEFERLQLHVEKLDRAASIAGASRGSSGSLRVERGSVQPFGDSANHGERDAAMRQLERSVKAGFSGPQRRGRGGPGRQRPRP